MSELTHKGWFYFVPIWCSEDGHYIAMRWTEWFWPVEFAAWIHNTINVTHGHDAMFPVKITGLR